MDGYGHAYLTSYGWTGSGTGLRKGAIDRPLAIPPKKNLSGLGKDRDEAFPFWDHLFAAAAKAIKIKVSDEDDEDGDGDEDGESASLTRTTTGILSNRRPILGTPVSASGNTTPPGRDPGTGPTAARLSLVATAKREAAKRGLYARFFRGPVLAPDGDDSRSDMSQSFTPVSEHVGDTEMDRKRTSEGRVETREERRERKRLKRERRAARAAKKAEKGLAKNMDRLDRKAQKQRDKKARSEQYGEISSKASQKPIAEPEGNVHEPPERKRKKGQRSSTQQMEKWKDIPS